MTTRKPYVRSMRGWWLKDPVYRKYMLREATSIFVAIYALILLEGLLALVSGEAAWNGWLTAMQSPGAVIIHLLILAAAVYHVITWFAVAPKVAPMMFIGRLRITERAITVGHYAIAAVVYVLLLWAAVSV